MKFPKPHTQILLAMLFGILAGIFVKKPADSFEVILKAQNSGEGIIVQDWEKLVFTSGTIAPSDSLVIVKTVGVSPVQKIKPYLEKTGSAGLIVTFQGGNTKTFADIMAVTKPQTLANSVKWLGDLFIRLLNMIAIPLVISTLIVGVSSLGDIKKFTKVGGKTLAIYLTTTALAITLGLVLANVINPGGMLDSGTRVQLIAEYSTAAQEKFTKTAPTNFIDDFLLPLVPRNLFDALTKGDMLQIVFFSVFVGIVLNIVGKEKGEAVVKFFSGFSDVMIVMVDVVMKMAPFGVFALIMYTVADLGYDILLILFWYGLTVLLGLLIQTVGVYGSMIRIFTKLKVFAFFKSIREAQTIAFTTSSSAATLPVSMKCAEENLGISKSITGFVLPLGATVNMDGTALYQGVATVFIAQVFGMDLTILQQLTIVLMATLASVGTAPVPGVGILMLVVILKSVHIPEIGIALILGIDRILDMCRTVTNVSGDLVTATVVASLEKEEINLNTDNV